MTPPLKGRRVFFSQYASNGWSAGGKERNIADYVAGLTAAQVDARRLDPWNAAEARPGDILHLMGSELYQYELLVRARARGMAVVLTPILVFPSPRGEHFARVTMHTVARLPLPSTWRLRRKLLLSAHELVCSSQEESGMLASFGVSRRARVIPFPVASHFWSPPPPSVSPFGRPYTLSVGRVEPRKRIVEILEATSALGLAHLHVGPFDSTQSEYRHAFEHHLARHPFAKHLQWIDPASAELPSLLAGATAHVLASRYEQLAMVNLEAFASGTRVVTTPVRGAREYLSPEAVFIDGHGAAAIATAIETALSRPPPPLLAARSSNRAVPFLRSAKL